MSTLTFQAFFISFLLLVFLIETSGNSISFLAVIIVDVLLVYFNYDKCYNNGCIYYDQWHCVKLYSLCKSILTYLGISYKKYFDYFKCWENKDNYVFAMSHIFRLLCDFIDDHFKKWKEFLPYEQKCIGN